MRNVTAIVDPVWSTASTVLAGGGTELNVVRTLEQLDQKRFDLRLVALNDTGSLRARVDKAGIPVDVFSFPSLGSVTAIRRAAQLVQWLRIIKPRCLRPLPRSLHQPLRRALCTARGACR